MAYGMWLLMPRFVLCVCHNAHESCFKVDPQSTLKTEMFNLHLLVFSFSSESCQLGQEITNASMMSK